jgi:Bacterial capsule synthesis protein PGA_cap
MNPWAGRGALGALIAGSIAIVVLLISQLAGDEPSARAAESHQPAEITIAFAGDITPGSQYGLPPDRAKPMFAAVRDDVGAADLAIGNLEGTLSVGGTSKCAVDGDDCFSFQAPAENADGLRWAGFDLLNLANNHAFDYGEAGLEQTIAALEAEGLAHTGAPGEIAMLDVGGVPVTAVGFAPYPWANGVADLAAVRSMITAARAEADIVVAIAHLGAEGIGYQRVPHGTEYAMGEDRGDTRAFAHAAVDAGASLVLASGPHVLRGIELYEGVPIAYSLANFAGWDNFALTGELGVTALLSVTVSEAGVPTGGELVPLRLQAPGIPVSDPSGGAIETVNELGELDFGERALRLEPDGTFALPESGP